MDTENVIKNTILIDVSNAIQSVAVLKEQIEALHQASAGLGSSKKFDDTGLKNFAASYQSTISSMTKQAEGLYRTIQQQSGNIEALAQYKAMIPQIQQLTKEQQSFTGAIKGSGGALGAVGQEFSKHWGWMLTGIGTASAVAGIASAIEDISKLDTEFQQLKTVLPELEGNQQTFNAAIKDSFGLSETYGTKIQDATEALRGMGRGYHELSESEKLAEIALKLSVADNFSPQTAVKAIEAIVGAYGKQAEAVTFATKAMDTITKTSHTAQVSANDLAESLLRSAAAAHEVGVGFDELTAMTAVIARNTGLSGQTIGDGLKSMLNSIHSDKAIKDLQSIGVEVYKIGTDGTKEFRNISDVLLDVSIKAKSTGENMEMLFKNMAGGRFQITKMAALLGDPSEYLRVLGNSINSAGFTDKQLTIQMDTVQRKAATLKASFEELLVTGGGESGFKDSLKSILDTLNQVLKGLNNISPVVWDTVGGITKFAAAFVVLRTAVNFATASYGLLRGAIITTTGAQEALNVATLANPWGALAKLIVLAGTALATYAYYAGQAASAQEKAAAAAETEITAKQSQVEMMKQQTDFMATLGNSYVELQAAQKEATGNEEKSAAVKKTMGTVSEQLAAIVGQEAADRILASNDIKGAITAEQQIHAEKTEAMEGELNTLRTTQTKLANDTIAMCNERIGAINAEATAFEAAATNIGSSLGKIDELMFRYYRGKAAYLNTQADTIEKEGNFEHTGQFLGGMGYTGIDADTTRVLAADADASADTIKQNAIAAISEQGRVAAGKLYTPGSYTTTPVSTGEVPPAAVKPGKKTGGTGTGPAYAPDRQDSLDKLWANHDVSHLFSESKVAADKYQEALAKLQVQQDLFGETSESDAKRLQLQTDRTAELAKETTNLTVKRDEFKQKANDIVAGNSDMVGALDAKKLSWASLSKEEKQGFIHAYLGETADEKLAIDFLDNVDKLTTKIADNSKESSNLSGTILKEQKSDPAAAYSRNMQGLSQDEQLAKYALGPNATAEQRRMVELNAAVLEHAEAERRLQEIQKSSHSAEDLKAQQVVVDGLKEKILELKDVWASFGEQAYDVLDKILLKGDKLRTVFKDMWKDLASDALHMLVTGKPSADGGGLLGQALGLGSKIADNNASSYQFNVPSTASLGINGTGASGLPTLSQGSPGNLMGLSLMMAKLFGGSSGGSSGSGYDVTKGGGFFNLLPASFANGGETNGPSVAGEDGKEVVIPVERNTGNSPNLLGYAAKKLGMAPVTPYLSDPSVAKQSTVNTQLQQTSAHIYELQKANEMMATQNQILINMAKDNQGNATVMPIITQVSSDQVMKAIQDNPSALQSILAQHSSWGYK